MMHLFSSVSRRTCYPWLCPLPLMATPSHVNVIIPVFFWWVVTWDLFSIFLLSASLSPFSGEFVCTRCVWFYPLWKSMTLIARVPHFRSWGVLDSDFLLSAEFYASVYLTFVCFSFSSFFLEQDFLFFWLLYSAFYFYYVRGYLTF